MDRAKEISGFRHPGGRSLRLLVGAGDPVSGTIEVEGDPDTIAFHGWIELMAAINAARSPEADS